jgi:hypothetical protein
MRSSFWLGLCIVLVLCVLGAGIAAAQDSGGFSPDDPTLISPAHSISLVQSYVLRTPRRTVRISETYGDGHRRPVERQRTVIFQKARRPVVILFWGARISEAVLPPYRTFPRTRTVYRPSHAL